ncbi:P2X purinoceptor 7 [Brachionus plicatilis]|uniref:P2X purinoceptor 7 n=1 Tax=Brachionus plicatilis TaxID=10195 RepID=A0A3M7RQF9_BRAPC|nr:P2X purinoceptor 7 [Brachionus plicatilis]
MCTVKPAHVSIKSFFLNDFQFYLRNLVVHLIDRTFALAALINCLIVIKAWCPTEHEDSRNEDHLIRNVLNYTIFIKNDVEFKKFNKKQRNILPFITNKCNYHKTIGIKIERQFHFFN